MSPNFEMAWKERSDMKKPSSKIREEIAKLQDQLRHAETREAERIGRIALRGGLGEFEIDEADLLTAFEELAKRFQGKGTSSTGKGKSSADSAGGTHSSSLAAGSTASDTQEA
jgi:hypothetical protein